MSLPASVRSTNCCTVTVALQLFRGLKEHALVADVSGRMVGIQLGWRGVLTCADAPEVKKEEVACIMMHHENHEYTASADSVSKLKGRAQSFFYGEGIMSRRRRRKRLGVMWRLL